MKSRLLNGVYAKFIILGLILEILYSVLCFIEPFQKVIGDTFGIMPRNNGTFFVLVSILIVAFLIYIVIGEEIGKNDSIQFKSVLLLFVLFLITLLFVWPIGSIDIFSYIYRARIFAIHNLNPYFYTYSDLTNDAFYDVLKNKWSSYTTLYGPIFILISSVAAYVGKSSLFVSLFITKGFSIGAHLINALVIQKLFQDPKITFLYSCNPLLLFEFAVNGHNDVFVIMFVLLALFMVIKKGASLHALVISFLFLTCAFLTKATAIIFLPVFLVLGLLLNHRQDKVKFLAYSLIGSLMLSVFFFFHFWEGVETLLRPIIHSNHEYGTFAYASLFVVNCVFCLKIFGLNQYIQLMIWAGKGLFVLAYGIICFYAIYKRDRLEISDITKYFIVSLIAFYLFFFTWLMPWYYTILITLLIVYSAQVKNEFIQRFAHGLTIYGILYYIILR